MHNRCKEQRFYYRIKRKKIYMDNQKLNTERLISSLRKNINVEMGYVFISDDGTYWSLTGWFNNLYFHVSIREFKSVFSSEIHGTTDCKEKMRALLIKYNLL